MSTPFVVRTDDCPADLPSAVDQAEPPIEQDWFPAIDPVQIRARYRFRDQKTVTPERLRAALIHGIITTGNDLAGWAALHQAAGYADLAAVPAPAIDGTSRLVLLYVDAVALFAKARIVERYRDFDATGAGDRRVEDLDTSIDELRRDAAHAIRDLLGRGRTCVELI